MSGKTDFYCGYCGGDVIFSEENNQFEHAEDGYRVVPGSPGDYASAPHNHKGTRVASYDVERSDERDLDESVCESGGLEYTDITDSAGYLSCGCHGSQKEHTCKPND